MQARGHGKQMTLVFGLIFKSEGQAEVWLGVGNMAEASPLLGFRPADSEASGREQEGMFWKGESVG